MSLGYFAMPLHTGGSDLARTMEQDLDRLGFLDGRRFEEACIGEHLHGPLGEHPPVLSRPLHGVSAGNDLRDQAQGHFYWTGVPVAAPATSICSFLPPDGDHREVTRASLEAILNLWQI